MPAASWVMNYMVRLVVTEQLMLHGMLSRTTSVDVLSNAQADNPGC
jgi:hypothetical protein